MLPRLTGGNQPLHRLPKKCGGWYAALISPRKTHTSGWAITFEHQRQKRVGAQSLAPRHLEKMLFRSVAGSSRSRSLRYQKHARAAVQMHILTC